MKQSQRDALWRLGAGMSVAGAVAASPLDELAAAALTAGAGIPVLPVQATATTAGGGVLFLAGLALMYVGSR